MSEQTVVQAVNATLKAQESFCKFLSANDSGVKNMFEKEASLVVQR